MFGCSVASVLLQGGFCAVTLLTASCWFVSLTPFLPSTGSPARFPPVSLNFSSHSFISFVGPFTNLNAWKPDESLANATWATCNVTEDQGLGRTVRRQFAQLPFKLPDTEDIKDPQQKILTHLENAKEFVEDVRDLGIVGTLCFCYE